MGLKVRLLGQTGAASPVWKTVAEPGPNGMFMWRSSGPEGVIFPIFCRPGRFRNDAFDR
tara:strand:+ start:1255 stop:1431 length:177 start_codon:yes stop_codon:yes gene_type:complete